MASQYPTTLDSLPTNKTNSTPTKDDHPDTHNNMADAINKIEAELGTNPSGSETNVKNRIAVMEATLAEYEQRIASLEGQQPGITPTIERVANMEAGEGNFGGFDYINVSGSIASYEFDATNGYGGTGRSLKMIAGAGIAGGQRIIRGNFFAPPGATVETDPIIEIGETVWYSIAIWLRSTDDHFYTQFLRLTDFFGSSPPAEGTSALGCIYSDAEGLIMDVEEYQSGSGSPANAPRRVFTHGAIPLDQWVHIEVGAKISEDNGVGWTELWIDGVMTPEGRDTGYNILDPTQEYRRMQFGMGSYAQATGTETATIWIDRCYLADGRIGPLGNPAPPPSEPEGYRGKVLELDPDGYWPLDNTDLNENLVDGASNMTGLGSVTIGGFASSPIQDDTHSTDLDGTDDRVNSSDAAFAGAVTVFGWLYRDTDSTNDTLISSDGANTFILRLMSSGGGYNVQLLPDGSTVTAFGNNAWPVANTGSWHHFALTFDPTADEAKWFIDGVQFGSTFTVTTNYGASPGNIKFGTTGTSTNPLDGKLCHCGWKAGVMSDADIAILADPSA